jgi:hypothetical protein
VTFQPGDRIDGYSLHVVLLHLHRPRGLVRAQERSGQVEPVDLSGGIGDAIQNPIDLGRLVRIDYGSKGRDEPRPIIEYALRRP